MALSGGGFFALLVAAPSSLVEDAQRPVLLLAALATYHLYFSQLFCEAHTGAHVIALLPPALLLLSLSPALAVESSGGAVKDAAQPEVALAAFTCWMMKVVLTSAYCGAGVCKLWQSARSVRRGGKSWLAGSTLQAFIFEAMFLTTDATNSSFGLPTPFSRQAQRLHVTLPASVLCLMSLAAIGFEVAAPVLLFAPAHLASVPFGVSGLAFHYGIALLQNIDFVSWWGPAYAFLLADPAAWAGGALFATPVDADSLTLLGSTRVALSAAPVRASLSLAYVAIHLAAVVLLRFWPHVEILPLSSFPMFCHPANLFDPSLRKWVWLSDKPHATGTLKNYAFPMARPHTVLPSELHALPFKYLLYGHGGAEPAVLHTNVEAGSELSGALEAISSLGHQSPDTFATDPTAITRLLSTMDDAKAAFASARRAPAPIPVVDAAPTMKQAFEAAVLVHPHSAKQD